MSQNTETPATPTTAVVKAPVREIRVVEDDSNLGYLMDTARFEHTYRIAGAMAKASLIPKHLKGDSLEQTQANCFLVVNQALRWNFDPFAVAPATYEVGGKLGFEGKLIAAVINARAGLVEKLSYTFNDKVGDALEITVSGRVNGEDQPRTVKVTVGSAKTSNQMWTKDPQQKLVYTGAIKWARRHKPEIIMGVLTDDDAEAMKYDQRMIPVKPTIPGGKALAEGSIDVESKVIHPDDAGADGQAADPSPQDNKPKGRPPGSKNKPKDPALASAATTAEVQKPATDTPPAEKRPEAAQVAAQTTTAAAIKSPVLVAIDDDGDPLVQLRSLVKANLIPEEKFCAWACNKYRIAPQPTLEKLFEVSPARGYQILTGFEKLWPEIDAATK